MFSGILCLLIAILLASQSAFVSIKGMTALFPYSGNEIIYLISSLEMAKLVMAGVLQHEWKNKSFPKVLKGFMIICVIILMSLTSLGVLAFLSKSNTESDNPKDNISLQLEQIQQRVDQVKNDKASLESQRNQLDSSINSLITNAKSSKEAQTTEKYLFSQKKQRDLLIKSIANDDAQINSLTDSMIPLKRTLNETEAKLGPIKFISKMFGIQNPNFAVNVVIVLLMLVFDPFAVANMTWAVISFEGALQKIKEKTELKIEEKIPELEIPVINLKNIVPEEIIEHNIENTKMTVELPKFVSKDLEGSIIIGDKKISSILDTTPINIPTHSSPLLQEKAMLSGEISAPERFRYDIFGVHKKQDIPINIHIPTPINIPPTAAQSIDPIQAKNDLSLTFEINTQINTQTSIDKPLDEFDIDLTPALVETSNNTQDILLEKSIEEIKTEKEIIETEIKESIIEETIKHQNDEMTLFEILERKPELLKNLIEAVKSEVIKEQTILKEEQPIIKPITTPVESASDEEISLRREGTSYMIINNNKDSK